MEKDDLRTRLAKWMVGRNGADEMSMAAVYVALLLVIINIFAKNMVLSIIALLLLAFAVWRMTSKNVAKRREENRAFATKMGPLRPWLRDPSAAFAENRNYKHLKCPECGQPMRVPRGKGRLRVTCPKCHAKTEIKS